MLTAQIMHIRMQTSSRNLDLYLADSVKFLRRYVTMDEICARHFDLEMQPQSMQWMHPMAEASDFKFGTQLGFAKTHHKTTPSGKVGVALG